MKQSKNDKNGLTLLEMMIVVGIFSIMIGGIYAALWTGQSTWFDTDTNIELQQNLRKTLDRISRELSESGFDKNGILQVSISKGTGVNGTDILNFSIPILCKSGDRIIDTNGDIAHWGASLTWGCSGSSCMDADNDCATVDYKYISYFLDNANQLVRVVFTPTWTIVQQDIFAQNIINFQVDSSADGKVFTITATAQRKSSLNRILSASTSSKVRLRNGG